jgi:hydroxyacylglutathione hydrolase
MWNSLDKLRRLPPETWVYCGHEYTQANARFAMSIEPRNPALLMRSRRVDEARAAGRATVPSTIAEERAANPFLRADEPSVAAAVGLAGADPVTVFAEVRRRKDNF